MKKLLLFFYSSFYILSSAFAQPPGQWTWMNGSNAPNGTAVYGTQGMPAPTNTPLSLYEVCDWQDLNGNFWFFGGLNNFSEQNNLWKYDPVTYQWTWMKGGGGANRTAVYGVQGVPSVNNTPGGTAWGAFSFVDSSNNLWMYGGIGLDVNGREECQSNLWKYDIGTNEWTWMQGPDSNTVVPTYGIKGIANIANSPGARCESDASWVDKNNNLWLFGGALYTPNGTGWSLTGFGNDLWEYNMGTNSWTWWNGANVVNQAATYGTKGTPNINNVPSARGTYTKWIDAAGDFWMFGGYNLSFGNYNDVWRYNIATNTWTWMSGTNLLNQPSVENGICIASVNNIPSARYENRASWIDSCGKFWTMGGAVNGGANNDLWKFDPVSLQWTFVSGDTAVNPTPVYGAQNVSSSLNTPPSRMGAGGWMDKSGNFWVFGGGVQGFTSANNDMWRYVPDPSCGACLQSLPAANFTSSDTAFCNESGKCINFFDHSTGNPISWQWFFQGAIPDTSSKQNPDSICYYTPGTYPVTLIVTNSGGTDTLTVSPMITLGNPPLPPTITAAGDTLFCSHASSYQWYLNGSPIPGATNSFYIFTQQGGTYSVNATDSLGCSALSGGFVITGISELTYEKGEGVMLYPNPASNELILAFSHQLGREVSGEILITDILGNEISRKTIYELKSVNTISVKELSNGIYLLQLRMGTQTVNRKFVVVHE